MLMRKTFLLYVLLSAAFIAVNVATLGNLEPWIDEVMLLDTAYNAAVHGSWSTTAWYRVVGEYPFSTYPPLYQMLAAAWIWLFGGSMVVVRSLNLFITFMLGLGCLRLMRRHALPLTPWAVAMFTVLLWGTCEMAWMYRNGRSDMLCALLTVGAVLAIDRHLTARSRLTPWAVMVMSALVVCSGVQAAVYLFVFWLFLLAVMKGRRREMLRLLVPLAGGLAAGLLLTMLFMLAHGRLVAFVSSLVQYSATLSAIAIAVLPWVGEAFSFDATPYLQKLQDLGATSGLGDRLAPIVTFRSFVILAAVALIAYVVSLRKVLGDSGFLALLFAVGVPFVMMLAGRFPDYYRWMAFLPLLMALTSIAVRRRWWAAVFGILAAVLAVQGIRSMQPAQQWSYARMRSFVGRQHFAVTDAVVCPFSVFYEMKALCDTCYFVGIFPLEFVGHVDYVIQPEDDPRISDYLRQLRADSTVVLTAIDRCEHPSLTLYAVHYD